jgi:hypothetical protein
MKIKIELEIDTEVEQDLNAVEDFIKKLTEIAEMME